MVKTRNKIDFDIKQEICYHKIAHPEQKQYEIAKYFSDKYKRTFSKSTISEIIKDTQLYLNLETNNKFRNRKAEHPELEKCLHLWYLEQRRLLVPVSDEIIVAKAKKFGEEFFGMEVIDFKYHLNQDTKSY